MRYMGSKGRIAKYIVPILQKEIDEHSIEVYIEPFVGGANIIDKIKCKNRYGYDISDTLIALYNQGIEDFSKIPKEGSKDLFNKGREYKKTLIKPEDMTLAEIGAIEYFGSFSNGGFPKGYANPTEKKNFYYDSYLAFKKQIPNIKDVVFKCQNYYELKPIENAVIYLDPPYKNTKTYTYANVPKFDYDFFWNWVRKISQNNIVFISEQEAPDDFEIVWEKEVVRTVGFKTRKKATEKLFRLKK